MPILVGAGAATLARRGGGEFGCTEAFTPIEVEFAARRDRRCEQQAPAASMGLVNLEGTDIT